MKEKIAKIETVMANKRQKVEIAMICVTISILITIEIAAVISAQSKSLFISHSVSVKKHKNKLLPSPYKNKIWWLNAQYWGRSIFQVKPPEEPDSDTSMSMVNNNLKFPVSEFLAAFGPPDKHIHPDANLEADIWVYNFPTGRKMEFLVRKDFVYFYRCSRGLLVDDYQKSKRW